MVEMKFYLWMITIVISHFTFLFNLWEVIEVKGSYHSLWSFGKLRDNTFISLEGIVVYDSLAIRIEKFAGSFNAIMKFLKFYWRYIA